MVANLGLKIKERRKELGMTQTELANKIGNNSPNARSYISKIENGDDNLTTIMIKKLAEALETTPAWLMGLNLSYDSATENQIESAYRQAEEDSEIIRLFHKLNEQNKKIAVSQMKALFSCQSADE